MVAYGKLGNIHNGHKVNPTNESYIIHLISSSVDVQFIVIVIQRWTPAAPVQGAHGEFNMDCIRYNCQFFIVSYVFNCNDFSYVHRHWR